MFVAIFVGLGFWWGLPLTSAILLVVLLARQPAAAAAHRGAAADAARADRDSRPRFWAYAGFAVLYGICETVNGNWSSWT